MRRCAHALMPAILLSGILAGCVFHYDGQQEGAEGFYVGRTSDGYDMTAIVLENEQLWSVYGFATASGIAVRGLVQGEGSSYQDQRYYVGNLKDYSHTGAIATGLLSASYSGGNWMQGEASAAEDAYSFSLAMPSSQIYIYRAPASLAAIVGSWSMTELGGAIANVQISGDGRFGGSHGTCDLTGTVSPRASGKNIFDIVLGYSGSSCRLGNRITEGIAVSYLVPGGKRQLLMMAVTDIRDAATVLAGVR